MTSDRDTFAAAALTGLLAQGDDGSFSEESYARAAYRWADAMLRERTNHDAAPAARAVSTDDRTDKAAPSQCRDRPGDTPVTQPMPKEKRAEVSVRIDGPDPDSRVWETHTPQQQTTPGACSVPSEGTEPVAWAVVAGSREEIDCEFVFPDEATAGDVALDTNGGVIPLYRHPLCQDFPQKNLTLTDAEREAVEASREFWEVEAEAFSEQKDQQYAATLRGLLERLGNDATSTR